MEKSRYTITEAAGPFIAGRRSPGAGKTLDLTEEEARYPLLWGEIEKPGRIAASKPKARAEAPAPVQTAVEG
jgi:hypothetical protein